ncbi:hypothetical protein FZ103_10165 [Streptomonospora sp. PA3]|nr:DUF6544 family protein [Streptomonospora sp. PA3]MUL41535.1 hypothetical protein [Streptomonospora sp. PA3]
MHGWIRAGMWLPFRAEQVIDADRGFLWQATVAGGLLRVADRYDDGRAWLRVDLLGLIPLLRAKEGNLARSALGRAVAERVWLPTALVPDSDIVWSSPAPDCAVATVPTSHGDVPLTLLTDHDGALRSVSLPRWKQERGRWSEVPFGMEVLAAATFGGVTVPSRGRAGWWFGSARFKQGEFFRFTVDAMEFAPRG